MRMSSLVGLRFLNLSVESLTGSRQLYVSNLPVVGLSVVPAVVLA
jgi:hypothetical protein